MTRLEMILREAQSLSPAERNRLVELLLKQVPSDSEDETTAALRGLAAWTESTQDEDWSEFYPQSLGNGARRQS